MRNMMIVASAALLASCGAPENDTATDTEVGGTMATDPMAGTGAGDDMAMAQNVPTDTYITRAAMSDMYEIQAGQLAVNKGDSEETRTFGRMMIDDHSKSSRDMKAALGGANLQSAMPTQLDAEHQAMLTRLEQASGADFDREYMTQQMAAHRKAMALHEGYSANGDNAELKTFAQQVVPVIRRHHERLQSMEGATAAGTTGASRPTTTGGAGMTTGGSSMQQNSSGQTDPAR